MEAPAAAAGAASRGPRPRPPEQPTPVSPMVLVGLVGSIQSIDPPHTPLPQQAQQTTNNPFRLPTELLLHALSFIQGTHPLRSWRNVAEDLFSLRAASRYGLCVVCRRGMGLDSIDTDPQ